MGLLNLSRRAAEAESLRVQVDQLDNSLRRERALRSDIEQQNVRLRQQLLETRERLKAVLNSLAMD